MTQEYTAQIPDLPVPAGGQLSIVPSYLIHRVMLGKISMKIKLPSHPE